MALLQHTLFENPLRIAFDEMINAELHPNGALFPYKRSSTSAPLDFGSALGEVSSTPEKFSVCVDVFHFAPEEIKVCVKGHTVTITGNHEEKTDQHGSVQRSFVRKYTIPADANLESLHCSINHKGHLILEAHKKQVPIPLPSPSSSQ